MLIKGVKISENQLRLLLYTVVALVVFLLIKKSLSRLIKPPIGDFRNLSDSEKRFSESVARKVYEEIERFPPNATERAKAVFALRGFDDSELLYSAKYFRKYLSGGKLMSESIESEWTLTDSEDIVSRLKTIRE